MAANDRIFYACQGVSVAPFASTANVTTGQMVHGLQSVGITTNFSLEQAFELGQIEIYENIDARNVHGKSAAFGAAAAPLGGGVMAAAPDIIPVTFIS